MPPAQPMVPGAYDFARTAWFAGLAASGTVIGDIEIVEPGLGTAWRLDGTRAWLVAQVRGHLGSEESGIAAALVAGERGGIAEGDVDAMRDSGLAHLLAISGLHVSAIIGCVYFLAMRGFALFPAVVLRWRVPLLAAAVSALAGIAYTVLTGGQVPTIRACLAALLVLLAVAMGREALSMRMIAVVAFAILLVWPETLMGPSFQMSFGAVLALFALVGSGPIRNFLSARDEGWVIKALRGIVLLALTGFVIELVLMPVGLFHFHRAGLYGMLANLIAIPLTTFVIMPALALALAADLLGLGAPFWWLADTAIDLLLSLAHWTASRPSAVITSSAIPGWNYALFVFGGLWIALWNSKVRVLGLVPIFIAASLVSLLEPADLMITGDGRQIALAHGSGEERAIYLLGETRSDYVTEILEEISGLPVAQAPISMLSQARCSSDFCTIDWREGGAERSLLVSRGREIVPERALAAACDNVDIVVSDRWLPRSCQPRLLKADRGLLSRSGGLAIDLARGTVRSVADGQDDHGWTLPASRRR